MPQLTIVVPEEHIHAVRREMLRAHAEQAAALRRALDVYVGSHERLDDVHGALVELTDLHAALEQVGWTDTFMPGGLALTAHPEVLADALGAIGLGRLLRGTAREAAQ